MRPVAGTGAFQSYGQIECFTDFPEGGAVLLPSLLVEINRQEVAIIGPEQWVKAGNDTASEMRLDDFFIQ